MQLESAFQKESLRRMMNSYRTVFTVANMLASIKLMAYEIRNLGAIAAGVEQKIMADKIIASLARVE
jgi:V/A-type H+/Na+-transporting ATPase subunit C